MDTTTNNNDISQQTPATGHDDHEDGKLRAEAAKRRIAAREANERADAAEQEAAQLRAQIAELRLAQARTAVTAKHPELTPELLERYAPDNVDADSLDDWADKAMGLVVELRGEAPVDDAAMTDAEKELLAANMELARVKAVADNEHVTDEIIDALCAADTPDGLAEWAAAFEQIAAGIANKSAEPTQLQLIMQGVRANKVGGGKMKGAGSGMEGVAQKLTKR